MITYVNTVLVGTGVGSMASSIAGATNGQYIITDNAGTVITTAANAAAAEAIKVGLKTPKGIKWSNVIKKADIKSYHYAEYTDETEDTVTVNFATAATAATNEAVRVVVRLTFKDLPTKYRKWTESYEVDVPAGSAKGDIVDLFVNTINVKNAKRARVVASKSSNDLVLTAMPYDDDDSVDSISPAAKVRFSVNAWLTRPSAAGFASKNKYSAAVITKQPGNYPVGAGKLVRDAEAQAMGYQGIINRGEGTWPIIKPAMNADITAKYDSITLEFENMYRTADDLQRRTKQTLQIFDTFTVASDTHTSKLATIKGLLESFISGLSSVTAGSVEAKTSDID